MKKNQKGFGLVGLFIAVIVLAAVGATGYLVYLRQNKSDNPRQASVTNFEECKAAGYPIGESYPEQCFAPGQTFVNEAQKPMEDSEQSAENGFLIIAEWGIKLKSTESPMSYKLVTFDDGGEVVYLTNNKAQDLRQTAVGEYCNQVDENGKNHWYLAGISRSKTKLGGFYEGREPIIIGAYYYYIEASNGTCSVEHALSAESDSRAELLKAAQTIQQR